MTKRGKVAPNARTRLCCAAAIAAFAICAGTVSAEPATAVEKAGPANEAKRASLVNEIVKRVMARTTTKAFSLEEQNKLSAALRDQSVETLERANLAVSLEGVLKVLKNPRGEDTATPVPLQYAKLLGDLDADLVYYPLATPCRMFDSRLFTNGRLTAGTSRSLSYWPNSYVASHGGNPSGCGFATNTGGAWVLSLTIANPSAAGDMRIWPYSGTFPNASVINFSAGQTIAVTTIVKEGSGAFDFSAVIDGADSDLIIDLVGYFNSPAATALDCTTVSSTSSFLGVVSATCGAGYTLSGGGCHSSSINDWTYQSFPSSATTWGCGFWTSGTLGTTLTAYARCCRTPGH